MRGEGWKRPELEHLTDEECTRAARDLGIAPSDVIGPPCGLIVGEMPGGTAISSMPLFPHPANSSGGRLMKWSQLPPGVFLGRIRRVNVFAEPIEKWQPFAAMESARAILAACTEKNIRRIVLLGERVGRAFGMIWEDQTIMMYQTKEVGALTLACIPHPSGLNRLYNDPIPQAGAKLAVRWASGWAEYTEPPKNPNAAPT